MSRGCIRTIFSRVSSESNSDLGRLFTKSTPTEVVEACPDLQEISIRDKIGKISIPAVSPQLPGTPGSNAYRVRDRLIPNRLNTYEP